MTKANGARATPPASQVPVDPEAVDVHLLFDASEPEPGQPRLIPIKSITIMRVGSAGFIVDPRNYTARQLCDHAALHAAVGGGTYDLLGRDTLGIVRRRQRVTLPGPPRPLPGEEPTQAPAPAAPPPPALAPAGDGVTAILIEQLRNERETNRLFLTKLLDSASRPPIVGDSAYEAYRKGREDATREAVEREKQLLEEGKAQIEAEQKRASEPQPDSIAGDVKALADAAGSIVGALSMMNSATPKLGG